VPSDAAGRPAAAGTASAEERRRRLRSELVRWHPDKFEARFGRRLDPGDKPRVMQRVVALSQALNALVEAAGAAGK
jgi:NF-kappa-B inhibitor-like protein 1